MRLHLGFSILLFAKIFEWNRFHGRSKYKTENSQELKWINQLHAPIPASSSRIEVTYVDAKLTEYLFGPRVGESGVGRWLYSIL